jgi:signal recognition particle subunit SRP54
MTNQERKKPKILNGSRRLRIARGSGTTIQEVNRLLKQFSEMQKMMSQFSKKGFGGSMLKNYKFN